MAGKVGRPAYKPTATQRRRIMRGIAIGLTLEQLALDLEMPERSMRRIFDNEIKLGRVRTILENLDRLHAAADRGNVSAMKSLAQLMQSPAKPHEAEEDDGHWAQVVEDVMAGNQEIH
jgi:hypothetical protein